MMRDRVERFLILPFPINCISESSVAIDTGHPNKQKFEDQSAAISVAIDTSHPTKPKSESKPPLTSSQEGESSNGAEMDMSSAIQRLMTSIKKFAKQFACKGEEEEEEEEEEMEIGYPTDVKHVTHIGLDGSTTTNHVKEWENLQASEIMSLPSAISLKQFEFSMAAQACSTPPSLVVVDP